MCMGTPMLSLYIWVSLLRGTIIWGVSLYLKVALYVWGFPIYMHIYGGAMFLWCSRRRAWLSWTDCIELHPNVAHVRKASHFSHSQVGLCIRFYCANRYLRVGPPSFNSDLTHSLRQILRSNTPRGSAASGMTPAIKQWVARSFPLNLLCAWDLVLCLSLVRPFGEEGNHWYFTRYYVF